MGFSAKGQKIAKGIFCWLQFFANNNFNVHIAAPGTIQVSFSAQFKPKESFEFQKPLSRCPKFSMLLNAFSHKKCTYSHAGYHMANVFFIPLLFRQSTAESTSTMRNQALGLGSRDMEVESLN